MGQQSMDKPPTKAKPSAEEEQAPDELDARLRQLAEDSWAAFFRDRTEENLQRAQVLAALCSPDLRSKLAQHERQLAGQAARTNPPHPRKFWRKAWVRLVQPLVANCEGDSEEVARILIATLPAELQAKCRDYPKNQTEFEAAVAKVLARKDFEGELKIGRKCGDLDPLKVVRALLRGLGMTKDQAKSLFGGSRYDTM
jgi:hypothetical protein